MSYPRTAAPRRPVRVRTWSAYGVAKANVPPEVMRAAVKDLQDAGVVWDAALAASENAPPDPAFVDRLRAIAAASERQHDALERAGRIPGYSWKPVPDAEDMVLSNELRPGGNRPGPEHLWNSFDLTVDRLALAMQGNVSSMVSIEYMELGLVLRKIIQALEGASSRSVEDDPASCERTGEDSADQHGA